MAYLKHRTLSRNITAWVVPGRARCFPGAGGSNPKSCSGRGLILFAKEIGIRKGAQQQQPIAPHLLLRFCSKASRRNTPCEILPPGTHRKDTKLNEAARARRIYSNRNCSLQLNKKKAEHSLLHTDTHLCTKARAKTRLGQHPPPRWRLSSIVHRCPRAASTSSGPPQGTGSAFVLYSSRTQAHLSLLSNLRNETEKQTEDRRGFIGSESTTFFQPARSWQSARETQLFFFFLEEPCRLQNNHNFRSYI